MLEFVHRVSRLTPNASGFTLIEMVIVIVLISILSVVALPRLATDAFDERGLHDAVKSVLQHARHVAVASRRFVCVDVVNDTISLTRDEGLPDGKTSVNCQAEVTLFSLEQNCDSTNQVCAPSGMFIRGTSSLIFDPLGRLVSVPGTVASIAAVINISNQPNIIITKSNQPSITVTPETGYVQ